MCLRPLVLSALVAVASPLPTSATTLTFDIVGVGGGAPHNFDPMPQDYGDRVSSTSDAVGSYAIGAEGPTPGVEIFYVGQLPAFWTSGYSTLANVYFNDQDSDVVLGIDFVADAGQVVDLYGFDIGNFGVQVTLQSITVMDGAGAILFSQSSVVLSGSTLDKLSYVMATPLSSRRLSLAIDLTGLGMRSDNVGLDNVRFGQSPEPPVDGNVPVPASLPLAATGFAILAVVAAARAKRGWRGRAAPPTSQPTSR